MPRAARQGYVTRPCTNCGAPVTKAFSAAGAHMFCNIECRSEYQVSINSVTNPCENCGVLVTRKRSHMKAHTFCGRPCYLASDYHREATRQSNAKWHPPKKQANCNNCGTLILRPPSQMVSKRVYCNRACERSHALAEPIRQTTSSGYIKVFVGAGYPGSTGHGHIYEHRKVMQDNIGRALLKHENVHHVNGDRTDNRLENLELWSSSQPSGQRVADKLAWANEIIALYEGLPIA